MQRLPLHQGADVVVFADGYLFALDEQVGRITALDPRTVAIRGQPYPAISEAWRWEVETSG